MNIALGTEVDFSLGQIVLDGRGPSSPPPAKGAQHPLSFWPMCIVYCVAAVAHLSYC